MKRLIFSAILFVGLATTGFSQEMQKRAPKTPEERAQHMTDGLDKKLSLTDAQKTQIYQINLERAQAMDKFRAENTRPDREQVKQQFEASETKILNVLTDSQKATFNELKAERMEKMKEHRMGERKDFKKKQ